MMRAKSTSEANGALRGVRKDRATDIDRSDRDGRISPTGPEGHHRSSMGDGVKIVHKSFYRKFRDDFDDDDF